MPRSVDSFDFRFPLGAYGHSSGWHPARSFSLNRQPDLAPRRVVTLVPAGSAVLLPFRNGELQPPDPGGAGVPFVRKVAATPESCRRGAPGISSGGGSALFAGRGGAAYKLKRCGLADAGFVDQPFYSHVVLHREGERFELSHKLLGGLTELSAAIAECRLTAETGAAGLAPACRPAGVMVVTGLEDSPFPDAAAGAVLVEVESDLRLDELVCMALSPVFAELFAAGRIRYDARTGFYDAEGAPLSAVVHDWEPVFTRLEVLGRAAGAAYRRLHDAGYLRGNGSAWFGNEVVDAAGEVSLVDFDGGTEPAAGYATATAARLRRLEMNQYAGESFIFLSEMRPKTLACFAPAFTDAVRDGYGEAYRPIPPELPRAVIGEHLQVWDEIAAGFGFSRDDAWSGFVEAGGPLPGAPRHGRRP